MLLCAGVLLYAVQIQASPLVATPGTPRDANSRTLVLDRVATGLSDLDLRSPARAGRRGWCRCFGRLGAPSRDSGKWEIRGAEVAAAGKRWRAPMVRGGFDSRGEGWVAFPAPSLPSGKPWRLRLEMTWLPETDAVRFDRGYGRHQLWTLPGLDLPAAGRATPMRGRGSQVVRPEGVRLLDVVDSRAASAPRDPRGKPETALRFQISSRQPDLQLRLLRATDFHGRLIQPGATVVRKASSGRVLTLGLRPGPRARIVSAVVALSRVESVTATIQPQGMSVVAR